MGVGKCGIVNIIIYDKERKKMSATILLTTAITGILVLAAISIFERTKKRRKSSEMKMRIKTLSKKIDEFFWRQDESNM